MSGQPGMQLLQFGRNAEAMHVWERGRLQSLRLRQHPFIPGRHQASRSVSHLHDISYGQLRWMRVSGLISWLACENRRNAICISFPPPRTTDKQTVKDIIPCEDGDQAAMSDANTKEPKIADDFVEILCNNVL